MYSYDQDATQNQIFLSGVKLVWIQIFFLLNRLLVPRLRSPDFLIIYQSLEEGGTDKLVPMLRHLCCVVEKEKNADASKYNRLFFFSFYHSTPPHWQDVPQCQFLSEV